MGHRVCKKSEGDFLRVELVLKNKVTPNSGIIYAMSIIRYYLILLNQLKLILPATLQITMQITTIDVIQGRVSYKTAAAAAAG